ncbi:hypothetical protein, partial [Ruminococcus bicirculans (ex Wegman et al. 2014)]|uniref:hypothetical protein n=1 Tax=Ruminococcus bicirculans (ex Wegman et al. 2014) TaxID=1160721 RepID=UPI00242E124F
FLLYFDCFVCVKFYYTGLKFFSKKYLTSFKDYHKGNRDTKLHYLRKIEVYTYFDVRLDIKIFADFAAVLDNKYPKIAK